MMMLVLVLAKAYIENRTLCHNKVVKLQSKCIGDFFIKSIGHQ